MTSAVVFNTGHWRKTKMLCFKVNCSNAAAVACAIAMSLAATTPLAAQGWPFDPNNPPWGPNNLYVGTASSCAATGVKTNGSLYKEIQDAVSAAKQNANIWVCPGTYTKPVVITQALQIVAYAPAILQPTPSPTAKNLATGVAIEPMLWIHGIANGNLQIIDLTVDGGNATPCGASCQMVGVLVQNVQGAQLSYMAVRNILNSGGGDGFGVFVQSGNSPAPPDCYGANTTQAKIQNVSVHNYTSAGIVVNEAGTRADISQSSTHGLGESATFDQVGIQIGYGAKGDVQNNVSTNHLGPAPHCTAGTSSVNFDVIEPADPTVQLQNNVSAMAEIGIGATSDGVLVQGNSVTDSLCTGIYVYGDNNQVQNNSVFHTDPTNPASTAIYVVSGNSNHVHGNSIIEATYGVASLSGSTQEDGDTIANAIIPLSGKFAKANPKMFR
jgi:parallel beta-helix repeat protein